AMQPAAHFGGTGALVGVTALTAVVALAWRLRGGAAGLVVDASANLFTLVYLPFLLAPWQLLAAHPGDGQYWLGTCLVVTMCSDIGGYVPGVRLGRQRRARVGSPNKAWEGCGGSVGGCPVAGALVGTLMLGGDWWLGGVLGLAVGLAATAGDLIEC